MAPAWAGRQSEEGTRSWGKGRRGRRALDGDYIKRTIGVRVRRGGLDDNAAAKSRAGPLIELFVFSISLVVIVKAQRMDIFHLFVLVVPDPSFLISVHTSSTALRPLAGLVTALKRACMTFFPIVGDSRLVSTTHCAGLGYTSLFVQFDKTPGNSLDERCILYLYRLSLRLDVGIKSHRSKGKKSTKPKAGAPPSLANELALMQFMGGGSVKGQRGPPTNAVAGEQGRYAVDADALHDGGSGAGRLREEGLAVQVVETVTGLAI